MVGPLAATRSHAKKQGRLYDERELDGAGRWSEATASGSTVEERMRQTPAGRRST